MMEKTSVTVELFEAEYKLLDHMTYDCARYWGNRDPLRAIFIAGMASVRKDLDIWKENMRKRREREEILRERAQRRIIERDDAVEMGDAEDSAWVLSHYPEDHGC